MPIHSLVKIWIHFIWGTHNHRKIITKEIRQKIFGHIIEKANLENIHIEQLHIRPDHVHMLFELPSTRTMEEIARTFEGESSYWINQNNITNFKFKWQRGYGAFSVSASQLDRIKHYIKTQDQHHKEKTSFEEYETLREKNGIIGEESC